MRCMKVAGKLEKMKVHIQYTDIVYNVNEL